MKRSQPEDKQPECEDSPIATDQLLISPGVSTTSSPEGDINIHALPVPLRRTAGSIPK